MNKKKKLLVIITILIVALLIFLGIGRSYSEILNVDDTFANDENVKAIIDIAGARGIGYSKTKNTDSTISDSNYTQKINKNRDYAIAAYLAYAGELQSGLSYVSSSLKNLLTPDTQPLLTSSGSTKSKYYDEAVAYADFCMALAKDGTDYQIGTSIEKHNTEAEAKKAGVNLEISGISLKKLVKDTYEGAYIDGGPGGPKNEIRVEVGMGEATIYKTYNFTTHEETGSNALSINGLNSIKDIEAGTNYTITLKGFNDPESVTYVRIYNKYQLYGATIILRGKGGSGEPPAGEGHLLSGLTVGVSPYGEYVEWGIKPVGDPTPTPQTTTAEDFALRKGITQITYSKEYGGGSVTFEEEDSGLVKKKIGQFTNVAEKTGWEDPKLAKFQKKSIQGYDPPNPYRNSTTTTITYSDKAIKKEAASKEVRVGDTITYTIRVYNEGEKDKNGPSVVDYIPEGLRLASNSSINKKYNWQYSGETTINGTKYKKYISTNLVSETITGVGDEMEAAVLYEKWKRIEEKTYNYYFKDSNGDEISIDESTYYRRLKNGQFADYHVETKTTYNQRQGEYQMVYNNGGAPRGSSSSSGNTTTTIYWTNVWSGKVIMRESKHEEKLMEVENWKDIQIECEVDKVGNGDNGYLYNIAEIAGTSDRDSHANSVGGKYTYAVNTSTSMEDDDDYDVVHKMIDVGGIVFIDGQLAKDQEDKVDGYYGIGEYPKSGVKVDIYKSDGTKVRATQTTNEKGEYKFEKLPSEYSYYVKFTYDGVEWIATIYTHGSGGSELRDSDAQEDAGERKALNQKFNEISYDFLNSAEGKKRDISSKTIIHSGAESTDMWKCLNAGLMHRTQVDLCLYDDVLKTDVRVNGKSEIYVYNQIQTARRDIWYNDLKLQNTQYNQDIYYADIDKAAESFGVYVTYRITVYNESSTLTSLNEIVDYYDSRYEVDGIKAYVSSTGKEINVSYQNGSDKYGYKTVYIQPDQIKQGNGQQWYIDITLRLKNAADTLKNAFDSSQELKTMNYAEITKFGTKDNNMFDLDSREGLIDVDSTPGNYVVGGESEDDNSKAPVYLFKLIAPRTITGTVWEAINNEIKNSSELYANNNTLLTYAGKNGIEGIKVELVEVCSDGTLRVRDDESVTRTDENGNYVFKNYIPGDYMIRFTYGEKDKKITSNETKYSYEGKTYNAVFNAQHYQSTQANPSENVRDSKTGERYWYASNTGTRYSDAYDDTTKRMEQIKDLSSAYSYEKSRRLLNQDAEDYGKDVDTEMIAYTGLMTLEIEKAKKETSLSGVSVYSISNIDFGLTPRTETKLSIEKKITHIKLTLSDGTVQIDANVKDGKLSGDKIKGISYIPGSNMNEPFEKIELEDELIQGATLQITYNVKVTNNTPEESLTLYKNSSGTVIAMAYYKEAANRLTAYEPKTVSANNVLVTNGGSYSTSTISTNNTENRAHTVEIAQLVDHSSSLTLEEKEESSKNWKRDLENTTIRVDEDPTYKNQYGYDLRGETTCVLLNRPKADVTLTSGKSVEQEIVMTSIIPQSGIIDEEDLNYYNEAIVTKLGTNVGRVADITPINVKTDETRINDPTGVTEESKTNYYIVAAASGVILVAGIVLIKKYVLKKKEE